MENQILIVGGLILGLIGLIFFLIIILRLVRKTIKANPINLMYYLFGFLTTSYFYPSGFKGIINVIRSFFLETYIIILTGNSGDQPRTDRLINSIFDSQLWFDSIIFVCFFLLVSFLSSRIMKFLTQPDLSKNDQVPSRNNTVVKNLIVSFVLVLALYFSISSIIAVPIVSYQSSDDAKLSVELKEELTTYSKNDTLLKKEYIEFIEKKEYLFEKDTNLIEILSLISDNFLNSKKEINSVFRDIEQLRDRAVARMKITDNSNINPRLRLKDKSELSGWYLENRSSLLSYLNSQQAAINIYTTDLLRGGNLSDFFSYQQILSGLSEKIKYKITKIPSRPTLGSDLGVFTLFTGWLLSVESYPLVIIIGLIGFGLLGAGGSTFIREQSKDKKEALIDDLAGVLIKGFTAAIVVFLGVQGSLAVLTTNTGNLNAYALFFVSFVAAVFSDDAWGWAKNRFGTEFNSNGNPAANNVQNGATSKSRL
ncbi:MAG: hypothetical protein AAF960_25865 [Bacteroidota bacterium]